MSLPVVLRPLAYADVQQIQTELEIRTTGLGDTFLDRLQEFLTRIESMPQMYPEVWRSIRAGRLHTFQYVVYYVIESDRVEILAVLHGSRDVTAWQSRVGTSS